MIGKMWKKVIFVIVVICCLFNIVSKFVHHSSLQRELSSYIEYVENH